MTMQFQNVFASKRMGRRKEQAQPLIDSLTISISEDMQFGNTRGSGGAKQLTGNGRYLWPGYSDNTNTTTARRGRHCCNGVSSLERRFSAHRLTVSLPLPHVW